MSNFTSNEWRVETPDPARSGYISYYEDSRAASFYWELGGGGDVVVVIYIGRPTEWSKQYPWAADRRDEIMDRLAREVIRQRAPNCTPDIEVRDDGYTYLLIRSQQAAS